MVEGKRLEQGRHEVQLFESPAILDAQVADSLGEALRAGGSALVIARALHLDEVMQALGARGIDCHAATQSGALHLLDAELMLANLLVDGHLDRTRFDTHIAPLVRKLVARGGPVHAYGEMVDVLWAAGNAEAMLTLEKLWSDLLQSEPIKLLCGYRLKAFNSDCAMFDQVLAAHECAHPTDRSTVQHVGHALAQLEQRALALQTEVEQRRRLEQHLTYLVEVTAELAQARTWDDIARAMRDRDARPIGAYSIVVWTCSAIDDHLQLLDATHLDAALAERYRQVRVDSDTPLATCVRDRTTVLLGTHAEYEARFPASWQLVAASMPTIQHGALALVPCVAGDATLGALCFSYGTERQFDEAEKTYQTLLARHCALALERVRLLDEERKQRNEAVRAAAAEKQARGDVELLYELIASFNRLDDIDAVYQLALDYVLRVSSSDRAALLLFDAEGAMRFRASAGLSERYRAAVEGHSPWTREDLYPAPIAVEDTETDPAWAAYRPVFAAEGIRSLAFVPIVHKRTLIGKFMLYRDRPRVFAPRELQLIATVAVHVAQAVERKEQQAEVARAYREERDARALADESARAREQMLSVVSHDLRNPLGTIMMGASTLMNLPLEGDKAPRVRMAAERIHRQAERMARLITDLVDFAGIQSGQLAIERGKHAPHDIVSTAREIFGPILSERGLRLETEVVMSLPAIDCDCDRAVQALSSLVSNALKVTPKGGQIAIGASMFRQADGSQLLAAGEIVFYVRDTGPGIDPDDLPKLFDRCGPGSDSTYHGTNFGLSIARGIVDAHGGRIWAESRPGAGSTFYFSLSPAPTN